MAQEERAKHFQEVLDQVDWNKPNSLAVFTIQRGNRLYEIDSFENFKSLEDLHVYLRVFWQDQSWSVPWRNEILSFVNKKGIREAVSNINLEEALETTALYADKELSIDDISKEGFFQALKSSQKHK